MSYDPGTYVDLRYLNKPHVEPIKAAPKRRTVRCTRQHIDEAIERYTYKLIGNQFVKVRQIPVSFA